MTTAKKMAQDVQQSLQQQGLQLDVNHLIELENCCELFLTMADNDKTHDKQLNEASAVLQSMISDLSWQGVPSESIALSFWKIAIEIIKPIARQALSTVARTALVSALNSFRL